VNLLVVGVSHRTADVPLLERLTIGAADLPAMLETVLAKQYVNEAVILSSCNRVELYTSVSAFHGGLADLGAVLAEQAGCTVNDLAPHLYVHYESEAVRHAFRVAAGLDSMVVGESQILGQLRDAYGVAAEHSAAGRLLHELMQQALRVGKRAHAETGIDRAGQSVVSAAIAEGVRHTAPVAGRPALVVGAGSMGALALANLRRAGAGPLFVTNRDHERAMRLAALHGATAVPFADLADALDRVEIVVTATASPDPVLRAEHIHKPLLVLDLAMPRDVAPGVGDLDGVTLVDIERLATAQGTAATAEEHAAEEIVAAEVETLLAWLRGAEVGPTVAALRARADELVGNELRRLAQRCPDLTAEARSEVAHTLHRLVQRLLHQPTVRVRQLAAEPGGETYAQALRELFDLRVPAEINTSDAL
jgi:glutamyl-tRNA reductase